MLVQQSIIFVYISLKRYIESYVQRMDINFNEISLLDYAGKSIFFTNDECNSNENKIFIFNKVYSNNRDSIIKIFEENLDKLINNKLITPNPPFNDTFKIFFNESYSKSLDKMGLSLNDIKLTDEIIFELYTKSRNLQRNIKIQNSICEKIKDNNQYQYKALECTYKNISNLYE